MKKQKMKKRAIGKLTLKDLLLLHKVVLHIDWNYCVHSTKTYDLRPPLQAEQGKLKAYGFTPLKITQSVNYQ